MSSLPLLTKVFMIVDDHTGEAVREFHQQGNVWIVESPANARAVDSLWNSPEYAQSAFDVTTFSREGRETNDSTAARILETVIDHNPDCEDLHVIGIVAAEELQRELRAAGFERISRVTNQITARAA